VAGQPDRRSSSIDIMANNNMAETGKKGGNELKLIEFKQDSN
jgi:hypothetical protein